MYETASDLTPIGGIEDPARPLMNFDTVPGSQVGRDAQTDCRTQSEAMGQHSHELDMYGWQADSHDTTLWDEKLAGGWTPLTKPVGGTEPMYETAGTRGADDIRRP